jgi:Fe-S cluster assembly protein SufD
MSTVLTEQNVYAEQFSTIRESLPGRDLPWLDRLRQKGMDDFLELGFPTTKLENWKYTNVAPIRRTTFGPAVEPRTVPIPEDVRLEVFSYPEPRLVFVNGNFNHELSNPSPSGRGQGEGLRIGPDRRPSPGAARRPLPEGEGIFLTSISQALQHPERANVVEKHLGRYSTISDHAFAAWNTAFFTDGAYIEIPRGVVSHQPINLIFVSVGRDEPLASYPRNLIVAGEGSQVTFTESFVGSNDLVYLSNTVTEIVAAPGAVIQHYKIERESPQSFHVAVINAHLDRDASLTSQSISFGGSLVRNDLNVALDGEGSHCTLNGLFAVDGQRLVDNHTRIEHLKPHASSRELYKGVLAGNAEGVFNGSILVHENAQKSDAVQYSKNLLLSKQARINTKPQLEIRNNDVRCFHGATIGQMDAEAIFYLKSRGIDEAEAKRILVRGFCAEIIDMIGVPTLRNKLERLLDEWNCRRGL